MTRDLQKDQIYIVKAKVESDDFSGGVRLVAEAIEHLDRYREKVAKDMDRDYFMSAQESIDYGLADYIAEKK